MEKIKRGIEHKQLIMIGDNYKYSLMNIRKIKQSSNLSESDKILLKSYEEIVNRVNEAFSHFDMLELSILQREYFIPFPKGWWMNQYPRSTFYRMRLQASRKFLALL